MRRRSSRYESLEPNRGSPRPPGQAQQPHAQPVRAARERAEPRPRELVHRGGEVEQHEIDFGKAGEQVTGQEARARAELENASPAPARLELGGERRLGVGGEQRDREVDPSARAVPEPALGLPAVQSSVDDPGLDQVERLSGIDVVTERDFVILAVHCPVPPNIIRSFMRALCTCDFDVPSDTPRSFATSLCSNPSTS